MSCLLIFWHLHCLIMLKLDWQADILVVMVMLVSFQILKSNTEHLKSTGVMLEVYQSNVLILIR